MRALGVILLAGVLGGCTTVKLTQRDGCWVRETHRTLRGTQEDVGPCVRPQPRWSEDRLTRLVQECVAQADYRWQVRALAAWNRHEPMPAQDAQETVIKTCLNESAAGVVTQNESLKERLAEVASDREALKAGVSEDAQHLRSSTDRLVEALGEAAKRPPPVATATATSTGTATTDTGLQAESAASGPVPAGSIVAPTPVVPTTTATAPGASGADASARPAQAPAPEARGAKPPAARRTDAAKAKAARRRALARALEKVECDPERRPAAGSAGGKPAACAAQVAAPGPGGGAR